MKTLKAFFLLIAVSTLGCNSDKSPKTCKKTPTYSVASKQAQSITQFTFKEGKFASCSELNDYIASLPKLWMDDVRYPNGNDTVNSNETCPSQTAAEPIPVMDAMPSTQHYQNQVEGVLEGDLIQTSPDFFYFLRSHSLEVIRRNNLVLIKSIPLESNHIQQRIIYHNKKIIYVGTRNSNEAKSIVKVFDEENEQFNIVLEKEFRGYLADLRFNNNKLTIITKDEARSFTDENDCKNIYYPSRQVNTPTLTYVNQLDLDKKKFESTGFLANSNTIYMTPTELFLVSRDYSSQLQIINLEENEITPTQIIDFDGYIKNETAIHRSNNKIYLATTYYDMEFSATNNKIISFSYDQQTKLYTKNQESISFGINEEIKAVNFFNSMAYIVTFERIDPLFIFQLNDENQNDLKLISQLESPGFSVQLKIIDNNKLGGLGYVTNDQSGFLEYRGIKFSLFDLSNKEIPRETSRLDWGDRGTYSEAISNSKALVLSEDHKRIMFPLVIVNHNLSVNSWDQRKSFIFSGAILLDFSKEEEEAAKELVTITHRNWREKYCGRKFYFPMLSINNDNQSADIQRIFELNNSIYTFSRFGVKQTSLTNFTEEKSLEFTNSAETCNR
jgi:uncharacterized secreted protein with C-terminal beta-propeller domain